MTGRLPGGSLSEADIKQEFSNMEAQLQQMQNALVNEQTQTAELEKKLLKGDAGGSGGLIGAIRKVR